MFKHHLFMSAALALFTLSAGSSLCRAQEATGSVLVSVEPRHGKTPAPVEVQDLQVTANGKPATVRNWQPAGDSPVQLLLLIDDSASFSLGTEINAMRDFVRSLSPSAQIGIGYMRNGMVQYAQQFTTDHEAAANTIRLSLGSGGADVSPYDSLSYAIQHWAASPDVQRREVVMITSGIEGLGGGLAPENPYVNKSIADAQRAGVVVFGIYNPNEGHFGHTFWRETVGQNLLSQMCDETGGESYIMTFGPAVDFGPYFKQIQQALSSQFRLEFGGNAPKKAGLVPLKVKIREKDADIAAPSAVFLKP